MTTIGLSSDSAREQRIPTWQIFILLAAAKVWLAWIYDTKILSPEVLRRMSSASRLPPEISALMARDDVLVLHFSSTVVTFGLGIAFVACCFQLALMGFGEAVPLGRLFRAVLVASVALILASAVRAAQILASAEVNIGAIARTPGSLASLLLPASDSRTELYMLLDAASVFELLWCVLVAVQLSRMVQRKVAVIVVALVWVTLTLTKWAVIAYVPRLLI
jgi:hypothetical protein